LGISSWPQRNLNDVGKAFTIIEGIRGRSISDTLRSRPVNRRPEPAALTAAEKDISRLQLSVLKAGPVERKKLMTELLNLEQRAGLIEAKEDPPRLRQQTQPIPVTRLQKDWQRTRQFWNAFSLTRSRTAWPSAETT
jgi:hypothetical protein